MGLKSMARSNRGKQSKHQQKLDFIHQAKNVPCLDCGKRYPLYVMDFDHRDRYQKKFNISQGPVNFTLEEIKHEVDKCDVVCCNCHRIRTWQGKEGRSPR